MIYYQDDILLTLSYLRGERTVPSTNTEGRKEFIQQTLNELYAAYRWKWNEISTYITLVSGIATLPSGLSLNHELNVSYFDGQDETEYDEINVSDKSKATQGDMFIGLLLLMVNATNSTPKRLLIHLHLLISQLPRLSALR